MRCQDVFVENMKKYRKFLGWSQEKLAHKSGLDMSYIGRIERKVVCPTLSTINKICLSFDVESSIMFMQLKDINFDDYAFLKLENGKILVKTINKKNLDKNQLEILNKMCY